MEDPLRLGLGDQPAGGARIEDVDVDVDGQAIGRVGLRRGAAADAGYVGAVLGAERREVAADESGCAGDQDPRLHRGGKLPLSDRRRLTARLGKIAGVSPTIETGAPAEELPMVDGGLLPKRYARPMQDELFARAQPLLVPGVAILDVGAGRHPTIAPADRPPGCRYVGLDIESEEIEAAGPGAYDESIVGDVTVPLGRDGEFDLVLSWQVLEHVSPLADALENLRLVLRPGGTMLAQLTGSNAAFAVLGRLLPHRAKLWVATRLLGHREEEKFPTRYDRSSHRALEELLEPWSEVVIVPFYRGAVYFKFSRPLMRAYLAYESAIERRRAENLATHYLIVATR